MPPKRGSTPKVLLFDLGGVIVRWIGIAAISDMIGIPTEETLSRFAGSDICTGFERGLSSNQEFLTELNRLFDFGISNEALADLWNSWVQDPYPGVASALQDMKERYCLACLSNTNDLHWTHLNSYFDCKRHFHHAFASHLIQLSKPDPACFDLVMRELKAQPDEIVFFDDTVANINAAHLMGIEAHLIDSDHGVVPTLQQLGYIN